MVFAQETLAHFYPCIVMFWVSPDLWYAYASGMFCALIAHCKDESLRGGQDCGQREMLPVHPGLARRLGLRFVRGDTCCLVGGRMTGFDDSVRMYCRLRRQESVVATTAAIGEAR